MTDRIRPPNAIVRLVLETGPLAVFFLSFRYGAELLSNRFVFDALAAVTGPGALEGRGGAMMVATAFFMVAIAASLATSWRLTRRLPRMAVITAVVVAVFGGLTLWLQDETFIKMKPTIVNAVFASILGFGLIRERSYLKLLLGEALPLTDRGWMIFTGRWVAFFIFLGCLNELVWRTQTTEFWVAFKTFANLPLALAFMAMQWPLLQRHAPERTDGIR